MPVAVDLPNGTSLVSRYKRKSRKQLPGNILVSRTRTVGPRSKRKTKRKLIHRHKTGQEEQKIYIENYTG